MTFSNYIMNFFSSGEERSLLLKKNIVVSLMNKVVATIVSFLLVPITINYVNTEQYGIWLTLSSIIFWINMLDFGMTHGFRNRFAESLGKNNKSLCQKYVSTTYVLLSIIFITTLFLMCFINKYISWSNVLGLDKELEPTLKKMFLILIICFCWKNILRIVYTMFTADQRPAIASIFITIESIFVLIVIWILTQTTTGNLIYLAIVSSGIPLVIVLLVNIYTFYFSKRYKDLRFSKKSIDFSLSKKILVLGGKFFIIQTCMLIIFQTTNIIISHYLGPEQVTLYNVVHKYYSAFYTIFIIIVTPFWSATTNAYVNGDIDWIKKGLSKLTKLLIGGAITQALLCIASPLIMRIWLNDSVDVPLDISIAMAINILLLAIASMYMYIINGIGKVTLQMIVYLAFSIVSIPLMVYGCQKIGLMSILIVTSAVYMTQAIVGKIQLGRLLNNTATGVWNK